MHSCIYEGQVTHHRSEPVVHRFQYHLFMVYLDLAELPSLVGRRGLIGDRKYAARSFLRNDHLFDPAVPLVDEVRAMILDQTGVAPRGPVRLLTQLRNCGYFMSPLNLFYVFDEDDRRVEYVVAEVNNTPWNERHCYLLWEGNRSCDDPLHFAHPKQFHVSPFMGMEMEYRWQLTPPADQLEVSLENYQEAKRRFSAGLTLQRRELSAQRLRQMTLRYPLMTAQIVAGIYFQALQLWWKKCPSHTHPAKLNRGPSLQAPQSSPATPPRAVRSGQRGVSRSAPASAARRS